jgi:hypothetical protein
MHNGWPGAAMCKGNFSVLVLNAILACIAKAWLAKWGSGGAWGGWPGDGWPGDGWKGAGKGWKGFDWGTGSASNGWIACCNGEFHCQHAFTQQIDNSSMHSELYLKYDSECMLELFICCVKA